MTQMDTLISVLSKNRMFWGFSSRRGRRKNRGCTRRASGKRTHYRGGDANAISPFEYTYLNRQSAKRPWAYSCLRRYQREPRTHPTYRPQRGVRRGAQPRLPHRNPAECGALAPTEAGLPKGGTRTEDALGNGSAALSRAKRLPNSGFFDSASQAATVRPDRCEIAGGADAAGRRPGPRPQERRPPRRQRTKQHESTPTA